ncbi:helix-turn-helix domain-containing protein [Ancylobacter oerskovii]|uniref:Helix-turn-helix domain-containing protein n=1 Tax=Ancylobacter oerskovii TaxID=459519 RepID=A0ABW4YSJ4_9HYPH|nr:helix-turn-helix transcriptional regulator [Ancylobacter oerskovii]MBS7545266.1 helix-turn-helix transcriptional regulator [Ancylobacter oerskovii]
MTQLSWFSTSGLRLFLDKIVAIPAGVISPNRKSEDLAPVHEEVSRPVFESGSLSTGHFRRTGNRQMNANDLVAMRLNWGLSQETLADRLGLPPQAYVEMEKGERPLKKSHLLALEEVGIDLCLIKRDISMLIPQIRSAINYLAEIAAQQVTPVLHVEAGEGPAWAAAQNKLQ